MATRMTRPVIAEIVAFLGEWAEGRYGPKLTWEAVARVYGITRQSLSKIPEINAAYHEAKTALREGIHPRDELSEMKIKFETLRKELDQLKRLRDAYQIQWVTWIYNASQRGITVDQLNEPLPPSMKQLERRRASK